MFLSVSGESARALRTVVYKQTNQTNKEEVEKGKKEKEKTGGEESEGAHEHQCHRDR